MVLPDPEPSDEEEVIPASEDLDFYLYEVVSAEDDGREPEYEEWIDPPSFAASCTPAEARYERYVYGEL